MEDMQSGELVKMAIEAYKSIEYTASDKIGEFEVLYNPASYSEKFEIEYDRKQAQGTSASEFKFSKIKPQDYSFDFIFDGTGVSGAGLDVSTMVAEFLQLTYAFDGDMHRPPFCKLIWGHLVVRCVLLSATVNYTLFKPDGYPLRAKVQANFGTIEHEKRRTAIEAKNSPDLTHYRTVTGNDSLPLMTYRIYGDMSWYPEVARYNRITNIRRLNQGDIIAFPPLNELEVLRTASLVSGEGAVNA
ncbi:Uncharacterised protein [BD1-7 clade bacterium]|uniref:Contractile injection system tube protein N-terminal domain-containing protein n=1 Tax=BD1-7 clade bacterium TaxID=2029982 RepID=A0A5S9QQ32_9GAMM|nr:Uncharacterised protein [BD1-7 clade bacterium]